MYEIPPYSIDINTLPHPIMTSDIGSFAYNTFKVRIPKIVDEIIALNKFDSGAEEAVLALRAEIEGGSIKPLMESAPDCWFWNTVSEPWIGRTWLEVPWYWAETFFYRRILEATGYFQTGNGYGRDPYVSQKTMELAPDSAPAKVLQLLSILPSELEKCFETLIHASLWGNRTDLSYNVASAIGPTGRVHDERANLLCDDTCRVWDNISKNKCRNLTVITDNAGTELLMDLALVDFLLTNELVDVVHLHLKSQPFFVSDAMPTDVQHSITALAGQPGMLGELGNRLQQYRHANRLVLSSHWFYSTCLFYFQMPDDLKRDLSQTDMVILKGDANYRRLLGDAHWPATASFRNATAYFPTPFVALRTLKAELITGLSDGLAQELDRVDPTWRVNGRRGVIQSRL